MSTTPPETPPPGDPGDPGDPGGPAASSAGAPDLARAVADDPGVASPTLPSTTARVVGFVSILLGGAAGAFIGYAVTDLQCKGDCTVNNGIGALVGAIIVAVGVAIVVQLALRAMNEWRVIQSQGGPEAERQRQKARERRQPPQARPRPRVR